MVFIRVKAQGVSSITNSELTAEVTSHSTREDLANDLGKVLYAVESQGYDFTTGKVYDAVIESLKTAKMTNGRYTVVYNESPLNVAVMYKN
jgi:hypothetical protein